MDTEPKLREEILSILKDKSTLKQKIYDNTFEVLQELKDALQEMTSEINDQLENEDRRIKIDYRDRGKFEAQIQTGGDMLIFSMHTNIFQFSRDHMIWQNEYVQDNKFNSYCGIINIYNFLADSFRYNRSNDEGYLIARIFVNREFQYCVEGKRQFTYKHNNFGCGKIDRNAIQFIVGTAIKYALEFDLLVPQYDAVKLVTVEQMNTKIENSKIRTGKRLGYKFNADDI